jgi:DNA-binding MarR family transcriptional regulator
MSRQDNRFLYLISRSVSRLKYYSIQKFQGEGVNVTPSQMGILFLLSKGDGKTMSELSTALNIDNSTLTRLADRLVREGFAERIRDDSDRRISKLRITESGTAESRKALRITKEINNEIIRGFSEEEIAAFVRVLESFLKKF